MSVNKTFIIKTFTSKLNGTVFIHGMFFAHEEEPKKYSKEVGSTKVEYFPKKDSEIIKEKKFLRDVRL